MKDSHLRWKEIESEEIADCRIFKVVKVVNEQSSGRRREFFQVRSPDWVTVIPVVQSEEGRDFVMVKQYRHGSGEVTIEFPAGTVEEGEDPEETVRRELLEETGFRAGEVIFLGAVNPNPAFMTNTTSTYLAVCDSREGAQNLDEDEAIDVLRVPEEEVLADMGTGQYSNGIMLIALEYYRRWRSGRPT